MQRLEVSCAIRRVYIYIYTYMSLGAKALRTSTEKYNRKFKKTYLIAPIMAIKKKDMCMVDCRALTHILCKFVYKSLSTILP